MVLISMIQDLDACTSDAGFFRVGRTNEPTNKAILGVGYILRPLGLSARIHVGANWRFAENLVTLTDLHLKQPFRF